MTAFINDWIPPNAHKWFAILMVAGLGFGAAIILSLATDLGIGITTDSIAYLGVSENLLEGRGLSWLNSTGGWRPITYFPPLYPMALSGFSTMGVESFQAARLLNLVMFAGIVWLVGLIVYEASGVIWPAILASFLAAFSPILLDVYSIAHSESLFNLLGFTGLYLLVRYLRTEQLFLLAIGSISICLAYFTRYVGLAFVATGLLILLFSTRANWRTRLRDAITFIAIAIFPMVLWLLRNIALTGNATNRRLSWHPIGSEKIKLIFALLWEWLLPYDFTSPALYLGFALLVAAIAVVLFVCIRRGRSGCSQALDRLRMDHMRFALLLFVLGFYALLVTSISIMDASTPMDLRITSPVYLATLMLVISLLPPLVHFTDSRIWQIAILAAVLLLSYSYLTRTFDLARELRYSPSGLGAPWLRNAVLPGVLEMDADTMIYTNNLELLFYFYGRNGHVTPVAIDSVQRRTNEDYLEKVETMTADLRGENAALVLFNLDPAEVPLEWIEGLEEVSREFNTALYLKQ